ncbi:MAG TPA: HAD family hydrolase [Chloroflexia bacterium]|nr:HAD family hydrolase [Chloroflexia bacterium]
MSRSPYQAVFFDAGDTLIDFYSTGERVTRIVYARTGRQIAAAQAGPYFEAAFHYALGDSANGLLWVTNPAQERHYWTTYYRGWLEAAAVPAGSALIAELVEDTVQIEIYQAFPDAAPTLAALRAHDVRLVLVSNAFPSMQRIMQYLDLERYFDTCLYSCAVGYEKPQPGIFDLALQAVRLPPAATCFVDDVPGHVEAATSLGIQGFLLDRQARHRHSPLPRLASLADLRPHLGI